MAKSKPIGVRFDLDILERIKKEQGPETPQAVLNYLMNTYQGKTAPAKKERKPISLATTSKGPPAPANLKGIDLAIWKAEQKAKNK